MKPRSITEIVRRKKTMSSEDKRNDVSVCIFNVLAPCYKRLSSEYVGDSAYQSLEIHFICLQESWFDNPSCVQLYESHL